MRSARQLITTICTRATGAGAEYLHDVSWARRFADASRRAIAEEVGKVLTEALGAHVCRETVIATDHHHVALERHGDRDLWVQRKGAMSARLGENGVLPGSMGTLSFHWRDAAMKTHCDRVPTARAAH